MTPPGARDVGRLPVSVTAGASPPSSGEVTRLVLLAFVSMGRTHGYRIRKAIEERQMHRWADVRFGSIYAGLKRLCGEGLLEEAGREQEGRGPPRTLYRITTEGRRERDRLLRDLLARPRLAADPVDVALSFFPFLPEEDVAGLLEERIGALRDRLAGLAGVRRQTERASGPARAMIDALLEHSRARLETEIAWSEGVRSRVGEGLYGTPPAGRAPHADVGAADTGSSEER